MEECVTKCNEIEFRYSLKKRYILNHYIWCLNRYKSLQIVTNRYTSLRVSLKVSYAFVPSDSRRAVLAKQHLPRDALTQIKGDWEYLRNYTYAYQPTTHGRSGGVAQQAYTL